MSLRDQFAGTSPVRQAIIVLLGVLLLGGISALAFFTLLRTDYRPAFSGLQPADAATIVGELEKRKLPYKIADGGRVILLPADRADVIRLEILGTDLPLKGTVGFELFNKSDMGLTDFAQRINYQRAIQGELARTILAMDGVDSVRVHLALGEDRLFREDRVPPKASVFVRMKNGDAISAQTAQGIQQLVAAAVDKLDPANVVILGEAGQVASAAPVLPDSDMMTIGREKRAIESFYEARVRKAIDTAYPHQPINVRIWADVRDGVSGPEGTADVADWSPDNRKFRLNVNLSPEMALASGARQDIFNLAASAIGMDASLGDSIDFAPISPASPQPLVVPAVKTPEPAPSGAEVAGAETPAYLPAIVMLLAGLGLGGGVTWLLLRGRRRLDPQGRSQFADRLAALVQAEEDDRARPSS